MSQLVLNGQTFVLNLTKYTIGRGEDCNILLPEDDGAVSRNHALLEVARDGAWVLTDLNSTNGTYLDGQRISGQIDLVNGSKFTIGKSEFKILFDEPATIKANSVSVPSSSESPQIGRAEHGFFDIPTSQPKPVTLSVQRPDIEIVERSEMFDAGLFTEVELRPVTTQQTPNIETNAREVGSNQYVFSKVTEGTGEDSDTAQGALENIELKSVVVKVACALPMISLIMPWIQASALGLSLQGTYLRIFQAIVQEVLPDSRALSSAPGILVLLLPMPIALTGLVAMFLKRESLRTLLIVVGCLGLGTVIAIYGYLSSSTVSLTNILGPGFYLFSAACLGLVFIASSSLCGKGARSQ